MSEVGFKDGDVVTEVSGEGITCGEIYVDNNAVPTALAAQDTYYQMTVFDTNGESNNMTPDHTNDHIIDDETGLYLLIISLDLYSGQSNDYYFEAFKNNGDTGFSNVEARRQTTVANKPGSVGMSGIVSLTAADTVELWVQRIDGGAVEKTFIAQHITMSLIKLAG